VLEVVNTLGFSNESHSLLSSFSVIRSFIFLLEKTFNLWFYWREPLPLSLLITISSPAGAEILGNEQRYADKFSYDFTPVEINLCPNAGLL